MEDVRDFLRERGAPDHLIEGGVDALIDQWGRTVEEVEEGYTGTLDDWLNDLDGRQLLEDVLEAVPEAATKPRGERVAVLDRRLRGLTRPRERCLWGDLIAARSGWSPDEQWWYWSSPRKPGTDLAEDLGG